MSAATAIEPTLEISPEHPPTTATDDEVAKAIDAVVESAPIFDAFEKITDLAAYRALPADWVIAIADVVDSTAAIADGRYKAVNMTGAAVIAAIHNLPHGQKLPYVFGGDGAAVAAPAVMTGAIRQALAAVQHWVGEALDLTVRVAVVPVKDIREARHDVRLSRYAPSDGVWYAAFAGGGMAWAEAQMKAGRYLVPADERPGPPDLSGLSCRWNKMASRHGVILSLILRDPDGGAPQPFLDVVRWVVARAGALDRHGHPVPEGGPELTTTSEGLVLEARVSRSRAPRWFKWLQLRLFLYFTWAVFTIGRPIGEFDPARYRRYLANNADFQKYDDGLKMTIDCTRAFADEIESMLEAAAREGILHYGTYRQEHALMTCLVPSVVNDGHFHFVDGAGGGYATAAERMKQRFGK